MLNREETEAGINKRYRATLQSARKVLLGSLYGIRARITTIARIRTAADWLMFRIVITIASFQILYKPL